MIIAGKEVKSETQVHILLIHNSTDVDAGCSGVGSGIGSGGGSSGGSGPPQDKTPQYHNWHPSGTVVDAQVVCLFGVDKLLLRVRQYRFVEATSKSRTFLQVRIR